jgi:DinB superfamily
MATSALDLLRRTFVDSCESLDRIVTGLEDDEYNWEPVPGCWTVHRRSEPRARSADGSGEWVIDYEIPEPDPAPVTTIAWRLCHVAAVNELYFDYAFGSASLSYDLEFPSCAADAVEWLRTTWPPLRKVLDHPACDVDGLCRHNNGESWPFHRIFTTLVNEQVHHGAEISLLRDLYRNRPLDGSEPPA